MSTRCHPRASLVALALIAMLVAVPAGQAVAGPPDRAGPDRGSEATWPPQYRTPPGHDPGEFKPGWARRIMAQMSLEEKVGQLFLPIAYGTQADEAHPTNEARYDLSTPAEIVEEFHLGGIIYFAWTDNLQSGRQVGELSDGLQRAAMGSGHPIPLLLAIDQEEGVVARMPEPVSRSAGAMALGAADDPELARAVAESTATQLRAAGVNQNYAPVADVNVNPLNPVIGVRSFGGDTDLVSRQVRAQVEGLREGGVASTIKHFPGHGDTDVDSHYDLPAVTYDRETLETVHLPPFAAAIEAGADAIMTAHIVVQAIDEDRPATVSEDVLTGLLREDVGYDGLIVTDALDMAGITDPFDDQHDEIAVAALQAGADVLLMPADLRMAIDGVLEAVETGELTEERIDESVFRILRTKFQQGLFDDPFVDFDELDAVLDAPEHQAIAQRSGDESVTLLRDEGVLPLATDDSVLVTGWGVATTATLADQLTGHGLEVELQETGAAPTEAQIAAAVAAAEEHGTAVVTTMSAAFAPSAGQQALVAALEDSDATVVTVAVRNPYDVASSPDVDAALATYSFADVSLRAAADVLTGALDPSGALPVEIPTADHDGVLYPLGHGLSNGG